MGNFAKNTSVSVEKSLSEVKILLQKHGATKFAYFEAEEQTAITFEMKGRRIRFMIPLPSKNALEFTHTPVTKEKRTANKAAELWKQAVRQRFRALLNVIKFKLVAIEDGVAIFEDEFLAYTLLPDGSTVGNWAEPQIEQVYITGKMPPPLLPPG